ncbi:MAG: DUF1501 domain-containing protein [Acidobacteria bacterium]|nr:DUF1501 domain-containing protein [Bryobacteraceae bacterium CoA2 C42]
MSPLRRRQLLQLGALSVSGFELSRFLRPANVHAQSKTTPRGSAKAVIFLNLQGGPSQMDMFDVKMGKWAPENRDVRNAPPGYLFPYGLLPKLASRLDDLAIIRSAAAWETVHSRGQYYLQTGHAVSPARLKEVPALGSVIAYESFPHRRTSDFLPPFVAMNYEPSTMYGPLQGEGCLPADASPLTLDLKDRNLPFLLDPKDRPRFDRRWELLNRMDSSRHSLNDLSPEGMRQFHSFGRAVHKMMTNPAISSVIETTPEERAAYGASPFGDACLIARNMVAADAGARFLLVTQPGWDHHGNIYGKDGKGGLYKTCADFDAALSALLLDLRRLNLLSSTLLVVSGEFGRTPGDLTPLAGREHYADTMFVLFAGAGVKGGRLLGATDPTAARITDFGWAPRRPVYPEDVCATIYSALGIDHAKRLTNTPSGRDFLYIDPAAGAKTINFREISELYT